MRPYLTWSHPAHPVQEFICGYNEQPPVMAGRLEPGMDMIEWYAGQALAGLTSHPKNVGSNDYVARYAFDLAEAMINERARRLRANLHAAQEEAE